MALHTHDHVDRNFNLFACGPLAVQRPNTEALSTSSVIPQRVLTDLMRCKEVLSVDILPMMSYYQYLISVWMTKNLHPKSVAFAVCRRWRTGVFLLRRLNLRLQLLV